MGELWKSKLGALALEHDFIHDVRGQGQMIGIEFGAPSARRARRRYRVVESARTAMFSQTLVVPLFHRHHILTQVAADSVNVIKLLPPLIAGEAEIDLFVNALAELLGDAERSSGWLVDFGLTMAKGTFKRTRTKSSSTKETR
jgi:4-aminobutyrate aminotransferase-like enzyme